MKSIVLALIFLCALFSTPTEARHKRYAAHPECNITMWCDGVETSARGERVVRAMGGFGTATKYYRPKHTAKKYRPKHSAKKASSRYVARHPPRYRNDTDKAKRRVVERVLVSVDRSITAWQEGPPIAAKIAGVVRAIAGIVPELAAKVAQIQERCGSKVISGVRNTFIAGTRTKSLHASGRAVDMAGNPSCIYAQLTGWPGGYSTDYARVAHVHISYGGFEHGVRFAHGGGRSYRSRSYASRHRAHRVRYARAQ